MNLKRAARLFTALALLIAVLCFILAVFSLKKPAYEAMLFSEKAEHESPCAQNGEKEKISINTAEKEALTSLYGIGENTAEAIIQNRPYYYLEDIMLVKGIGERRFSQIKDFICLE